MPCNYSPFREIFSINQCRIEEKKTPHSTFPSSPHPLPPFRPFHLSSLLSDPPLPPKKLERSHSSPFFSFPPLTTYSTSNKNLAPSSNPTPKTPSYPLTHNPYPRASSKQSNFRSATPIPPNLFVPITPRLHGCNFPTSQLPKTISQSRKKINPVPSAHQKPFRNPLGQGCTKQIYGIVSKFPLRFCQVSERWVGGLRKRGAGPRIEQKK